MANMTLRRRTAMRGAGSSVDWESIARGMCDGTTEFSLTDYPAENCDKNTYYAERKGLKAVIIPSLTALGQSVFSGCSGLESVTFPSNLVRIQYSCFNGCTSLVTFTLPASVNEIGQYAFSGCRNLTHIICEATTPPAISSYSFNNTNNCPIYVPDAAVNDYKAANNWSAMASRIFPLSDIEP